ncbi:MAG: RagB/SusD family nutrient uptake outer membrane protein [Prevotellaceae bacterium]|nr:RagB/SusD family nutrient uptake outer membrane protein [Prevotellaceae bacterium]
MKKLFIILCVLWGVTACTELDIPPKNIVTDDDLMSNESGLEIYMARMYSNMPLEEFKYSPFWGFEGNSWLGAVGTEGTGEALNREGGDNGGRAFTYERTSYWGQAFTLLRDANHLIETLPEYQGNFPEQTYNHYLGEAYFVRAFVFYALAKRYGGVPLVTRVIEYPAAQEALEEPRASEEETWGQILADFDKAAELLRTVSPMRGYANKFVALAYKSEAMLYAGCVAKYNQDIRNYLGSGLGQKTGVRVIGFAEDRWQEASKKYFREAYKAARTVMTEGGYSLYKKKWSATDREGQYQNMVDMFSDLTSPENIYVREYVYPTLTHGYDAYSCPYAFRTILAGGTCPTLDFVELFDGFPRYPDGSIKVTDGNSNTDGNYELYNNPMDFFANAEPRLRAYVIFPGDIFRNKVMEIRAGVYTGTEPVAPLFNDYSYAAGVATRYQDLPAYTTNPKTLFLSSGPEGSQEKVTLPGGGTMTAAGENGPWTNNGEGAMAGFYGRKWLQTNPAVTPGEGKSAQPFVLMRYADVLLNAAEAAVELALAGESSPTGDDMLQVATDAIKAIRERAGATQLTANLAGDETSRNLVRKERRKELALEHKTKWDLRRWRVQHEDGRDYFWGEYKDKNTFGTASNYRFRGLHPFYSAQSGKYFFDARINRMGGEKTFGYNPVDYYFAIPGGEVTKSEYIDQQPNR